MPVSAYSRRKPLAPMVSGVVLRGRSVNDIRQMRGPRFEAFYVRGAPFFFLRFPPLGSLRPLPKTDLRKHKTATHRTKNPMA